MRRILALSLILTVAACLCSTASAADKRKKTLDLFNGKNLDGWGFFLVDPNVKMKDVWSVKDKILICKGEPMGYLCTEKEYTNFRLIVEWRWAPGKEPGNSGVLLRITGKPRALPNCVEAQLKSGNAGDFWAFHGFQIKGAPQRTQTISGHELGGELIGISHVERNENKPGQWNKYQITARAGTITLVVNGKELNKATDCTVVPGKIGLQSEGGEIHFRTVRLTPIEK